MINRRTPLAELNTNLVGGSYTVGASASGLTPASFELENAGPWYVTSTGDDDNDCLTPLNACASIDAAMARAMVGGAIYVSAEVYPANQMPEVEFSKSLTLSGGWDSTFTTQVGMTILDGQGAYTLINILYGLDVHIDRFWIRNGYNEYFTGGIHCSTSTLTITNSTITGNFTGRNGAGMYSTGCEINLDNVTVSGNRAQESGGGIYMDVGSTLSLNSVTISHNSSVSSSMGAGLALYNNVDVVMQNSLLADNIGNSAKSDCAGSLVSLGYNLIGYTANCNVSQNSGDLFNIEARVVNTALWSGVTALQQDSPAVNSGNPAGCTDHLGQLLTVDQRGVLRSDRCDIGAFEIGIPGPAVGVYAVGGMGQKTEPNNLFNLPLQAVVLDTKGDLVPGVQVDFTAPASGPSLIFTDTGGTTTSRITDINGLATTASLRANDLTGVYTTTAIVAGLPMIAQFSLENRPLWYVALGGNDSNTCLEPTAPCATINGVLAKPDFLAGDLIRVASGTYTSASAMANMTKSARVIGGWDATFTTQNGMSILDGEGANQPLGVAKKVYFERFEFANGLGNNVSNSADLTLQDCVIRNASQRGLINYGTAVLKNTIVRENGGYDVFGGTGLYNYYSGMIEIWNSSIINNQGQSGAGITNYGNLIINNSTISGNAAGGLSSSTGGGIFHLGSTLKISSSTITGNSAGESAGGIVIGMSSTATLQNTILAENTAKYDLDCKGQIISDGYNLIGDSLGCTIVNGPGDQIDVWFPKISPLGDNGGPTPTHFLYATSPAIDAGNPAGCTDHLGNPLIGDQRGQARSLDGDGNGSVRCDIGSFEATYPPPALPPTTTWYVSTTGNDANSCQSVSASCKTINGALNKANPGDSARVATGTYATGTNEVVYLQKSVFLSGGWNSTFTTQSGTSTIDGKKLRRAMRIADSVRTEIDHFTFTNGYVSSGNGGGISTGILIRMKLRYVTVQNSESRANGGGIDLGSYSVLWLFDSQVKLNKVSTGSGGGIKVGDHSLLALRNTTLESNQAADGGAIYSGTYSILDLANSTIKSNTALARGGGIFDFQLGTIKIVDSLLDLNSASYDNGGGIYETTSTPGQK